MVRLNTSIKKSSSAIDSSSNPNPVLSESTNFISIALIMLAVAFVILLASLSPYRNKNTPESLRITPTQTPTRILPDGQPPVILEEFNLTVSPNLSLKGSINGSWLFEGIFTIKLFDASHNLITQTQGREAVGGSWQQEGKVLFIANINFDISPTTTGYLSFESANPSGLPENQKIYEIPVSITNDPLIKNTPTLRQYSPSLCPKSGWVNCMPGPEPRGTQCDSNFLQWAKENCPGFKGAAL